MAIDAELFGDDARLLHTVRRSEGWSAELTAMHDEPGPEPVLTVHTHTLSTHPRSSLSRKVWSKSSH